MIRTWNTYKKKEQPQIRTLADGVFNKPLVVEPTLRYAGFNIREIEIDPLFVSDRDTTPPKKLVKNELSNTDYTEAVYYVWNGRDGWTRWITIGWK